ncbi:SpoIIE family protein phosphatase [bacterium]|nr:SpoIIE family protein phosphatase [bacterium]
MRKKNIIINSLFILLFIGTVLTIFLLRNHGWNYANLLGSEIGDKPIYFGFPLKRMFNIIESDTTTVLKVKKNLTNNEINNRFIDYIDSIAVIDTTIYIQEIVINNIDGYEFGNDRTIISQLNSLVRHEDVIQKKIALINIANITHNNDIFNVQLKKIFVHPYVIFRLFFLDILILFILMTIAIKKQSEHRSHFRIIFLIYFSKTISNLFFLYTQYNPLLIIISMIFVAIIPLIVVLTLYKRLARISCYIPQLFLIILTVNLWMNVSWIPISIYFIMIILIILLEVGVRKKIYYKDIFLFLMTFLTIIAMKLYFDINFDPRYGIEIFNDGFILSLKSSYLLGLEIYQSMDLLIYSILIIIIYRITKIKNQIVEKVFIILLKTFLTLMLIISSVKYIFLDYSPQLLRTIALGLMTLIFYYIISKYLKLFPFINPVRFNVQKKLVKLLNVSYNHTNPTEYSNFFLSFLKKIQPKAKISIISQQEIEGDKFPKLEYSRLETVVKLKPADKNYLNLDLELLDDTEIGKQVEDFNNSDMPHLLYPIYNNQEELQAVIVFGKFPGIYWQKSLAEAIYKLIEVFQGFYHNFLVQERYLEQSKIIVKEQEEKLYNQKLAQLKTQQNEELRAEKKLITESIQYASLIQKSLLPQSEELKIAFPDNFIIWQERDIVGGDLYWASQVPNQENFLFSVIDCTGHGIPGALMSVTANSSLERITKEHQCYQPNLILNQLHQIIGATLHQAEKNTQQDGMDMSIINYNKHSKKVHFAGAKHDLIIIKGKTQELQVIKGDKYSIGGLKWEKEINFTQHELDLEKGDTLYLFTDGILDQPYPNEDNKLRRLGTQRWYELLVENNQQSMPEIKSKIQELITQMIKSSPQRDDICIVGIRVN